MSLFNSIKNNDIWSFQNDAMDCIIDDFKKNIFGRFLLVLPTGSGKTLTAIRTIDRMLKQGIISKQDKILWIVHTLALYSQAQSNLDDNKNYLKFGLSPELASIINIKMKSDAAKELDRGSRYKLIIIDEAHHAVAATYSDFFDYPIGILGLTATPSRTDQSELPFDKISYSITFKELVRRGVVLLPKFLPELNTDITINANSLREDSQLEEFDNDKRNQLIAHYIFREADRFKFSKVIVFVGTNLHVKKLFEVLKSSNELLKNKFKHIGYIFGGDNNDKSISNDDYLKWHHSQDSSILVNCRILNEGYDDSKIDTVVMATPTNSILYYMQCIGRVVRVPENNSNAKAFVIEIVDKLPNISYRIDNRWLFAEISDYLEPLIEDIRSHWPWRVISLFKKLITHRAVLSDLSIKDMLSLIIGKKINLLLFNDVPQNNFGRWRILCFSDKKLERIKLFNELSENIEDYHGRNHDYLFNQKYTEIANEVPMKGRVYRASLIAALYRAFIFKKEHKKVDSLIYLSLN